MAVTTPWEAQAACLIELSSPLKVLYFGFSGVSLGTFDLFAGAQKYGCFCPLRGRQ